MDTLLLATHNQGKAAEFAVLLEGLVGTVKSAADLNLPEPEETEITFSGNALIKARAGMEATGLPTLADDSGLVVAGLNGAPGVYSARWAGPGKDFGMAMQRIQNELGDKPRHAQFTAVLALVLPDQTEHIFEGECKGELVWPPRGVNGFGYDPMFQPYDSNQTFAEMDAAAKHAISHRAQAVEKLKAFLAGQA